MKAPRPSSAGFTLIELLTVIAIVGVLATILLVTLGRTREAARKAQCGSNLRQIATALMLFAGEHHNQLPPALQPSGTPLAGAPWSAMLYRGGYLPGSFSGFSCPSDSVAVESNATAVTTNPSYPSVARSYTSCSPSFSPKTSGGASDPRTGLNLANVSRPASTFMLTEWHLATARMVWENPASIGGRDIIQGAKGLTTSMHADGGRHYAYLDGHVAFLSISQADNGALWGE